MKKSIIAEGYIINKVDNCYQYSKHGKYLLLGYLNKVWIYYFPPAFILSLSHVM